MEFSSLNESFSLNPFLFQKIVLGSSEENVNCFDAFLSKSKLSLGPLRWCYDFKWCSPVHCPDLKQKSFLGDSKSVYICENTFIKKAELILWIGLVYLSYGTSAFVCYLIPKRFFLKNSNGNVRIGGVMSLLKGLVRIERNRTSGVRIHLQ